MTETEIQARLSTVFRTVFDQPALEVGPDTTAADVADWDSLSHINLIVAVEKSFRVRFTTAEVQRLANVGELMALIAAKTRG